MFTTTIGTQYDGYRNHTTIIGTTKQSQKYVFFRKFDVFHGKNGCDCEDKTYSNCYGLKYSEIVLHDTLNPLKHIGTTTNCTTIGTFTLQRKQVKSEPVSLSVRFVPVKNGDLFSFASF